MQRTQLIDQLARNGEEFRVAFGGLRKAAFQWRPAPDKWSPLEVLCHLHDEEREDFRARLSHVLTNPEVAPPKIDPVAWVSERRYAEQDPGEVLRKFVLERTRSVQWLRSLTDAPWNNAYQHPTAGALSGDLLLANWVAHDLHHFRQLNNLRYGYLASECGVPLDYAGTW